MKTASYSRQCKAVYRRCALRITSSFCTVSEEAAVVVAGTIPIDLLAAERRTGSTGSRTQRSNEDAPYTLGTEPKLKRQPFKYNIFSTVKIKDEN